MTCANDKQKIFQNETPSRVDVEALLTFIKDHIIIKVKKIDCDKLQRVSDIPAGFTYLGQMIAHDIVPSTKQHPNLNVYPALNLDSLYEYSSFKKDEIFDEIGRFKLGQAQGHGIGTDLLRKCGIAQIPDQRNDENVIISQMHLLWQKLHNIIITDFQATKKGSRAKHIKNTRNILICIFNEVVKNDFLKHVLHPIVWELYENNVGLFLYDYRKDLNVIPFEFSRAAFRFGHSMVRENYKLARLGDNKNLSELLINPSAQLASDKVIDWIVFFDFEPFCKYEFEELINKAERIDTTIVCAMYEVHHLGARKDIRDINLLANIDSDVNILTGEAIYHKLCNIEEFNGLLLNEKYKNIYKKLHNLDFDLPLWPYILLEAELFGGESLGLVGSILNAEVLHVSSKSALNKISHSKMRKIEKYINIKIKGSAKGDLLMKHILEFLKL